MGHYGSATVKRQVAWSNSRTVECLNMGVMTKEFHKQSFANAPKTAKVYRNKKGVKSYAGTKCLKGTQNPGLHCCGYLMFWKKTIQTFLLVSVRPNALNKCKWCPGPHLILTIALPLLRTYPPRFALKLVKLFPRFLETKVTMPKSEGDEVIHDSFNLFKNIDWVDFWDRNADVDSVFLYLRGSVDLQLEEWREVLPTHVQIISHWCWHRQHLF